MSSLDVQVGGSHYKDMKIQPVEFIHANGIPFIEGCVIKYVSRWRSKNGVKDLEKARHFIDLLIELESAHGLETRNDVHPVGASPLPQAGDVPPREDEQPVQQRDG